MDSVIPAPHQVYFLYFGVLVAEDVPDALEVVEDEAVDHRMLRSHHGNIELTLERQKIVYHAANLKYKKCEKQGEPSASFNKQWNLPTNMRVQFKRSHFS